MAHDNTLELDSIVVQSSDPLEAPLGEETVLMSIDRGNYYSISDTAGDIWGRLKTPLRIKELCAALASEYGADEAQVIADTMAFLEHLAAEGLIEVR